MTKTYTWLRSIEKATCYDKKTGLVFSIFNNADTTSLDDKFTYRCTDNHRRLMFDRKINFATAIVVINSWAGDVEVKQRTPAG